MPTLPSPCIVHLKKQAKKLHKTIQVGESPDLEYEIKRFSVLEKYAEAIPEQILSKPPKLTDCQHVIAKEYLFPSWADLIKQLPKDQKALESILAEHDTLTYSGFFHPGMKRDGIDKKSLREELLTAYAIKEFRFCVDWLSRCQTIKTPNPKIGGSYTLKHCVETWTEQNKMRTYIGNGAFIAAVIHLAIPYKKYWASPNIHVAISNKCKHLKSTPEIH